MRRAASIRLTRPILLAVLLLLGFAFGGCGVFRADAVVGPDLKPRLGTSVSVPLGR